VIRPDDRLARLLARLDRLPRAARRALVLLLPLALLAALVASVVFVPRNEHHRTRAAATPTHVGTATTKPPVSSTSPPGKATATPEPEKPAGGDVGDRQVAAAIDPARGFIESYVAIAYGRARPRAIRGADPKLVRTLVAGRSRVSPAQRKRHPRVVALRVTAFSPDVAQATAVVADGAVRYPLVFFLDHRHGGWLVTQMAD
jgi:hypothetical protein